MAQKKIILDLDTGIDDALAIAYALGSPEVELIGILASYGNVLTEQSARNSLAILDFFGHPEVPVFMGCTHSWTTDSFSVLPISAFIHGKNGIGEVEIPASSRSVSPVHGVDFLIESVHKYGKDLIFIPTGPQTNLATAIKKDPTIVDEIGNVVFMGGALTVPGNIENIAEANISQDPEATDFVFKSGIPCTMVGLDITLKVLLTKKETQTWRDLGTPQGKFLADMTDYYIKAYETTSPHLGGCALHDPLAVGVAVDPTLIKTHAINLQCDLEGVMRGRTIGDPSRLSEPAETIEVGLGVDIDRALKEFMSRLTALVKG